MRRIYVRREPFFQDRFDFLLGSRTERAKPLEWEVVDDDHVYEPTPTFCLDASSAQNLMDELYRAGLRPTEEGTPGQLKVMERHLYDMRALVFDKDGNPRH